MSSKVSRLYKFFKPNHYRLSIVLNKQKLLFSGLVKIEGKLQANTLRLHCKDLTISEVKVNKIDCQYKIDKINDELIVYTTKKQQPVTVEIKYQGRITKPMHGLYPCYGRRGEVILATQFESHHAREVFPCVDEPEAKAVFELDITTDKNDTVISNTNPIKVKKHARATTTYFQSTPKMSTYLLAFVSGKLKSKQVTTSRGIKIKAWSTCDQVQNTGFALEVASKALDFFEDYFEIDYPLTKCDLVALPDFAAGAMENWGLITFRETGMLVDPKNTSTSFKQYVAMVTVHEVAHQWFGNLVTMRWWSDLWLNEGFASWIEYLVVDHLFPHWHMWSHFLSTEQLPALRIDALKNTHPIKTTINHPDDIRTNFDHISYAKGASVIHMLYKYLGEADFKKGLRYYLKTYAYQNTETDDLWEALEKISHKPIKFFMDSWVNLPGFPILEVNYGKKRLTFNQRRFISNGSKVKSPSWPIPVHIDNRQILIDSQQSVTNLKSHPTSRQINLNPGHSGYFICKYWGEYYRSLAKQFASNKDIFDGADLFGLLSDMLAINKAGKLPIDLLLEVTNHLDTQNSIPVWDVITLTINDIRRVMGKEARTSLKPYIRKLVEYQVKRLGWEQLKTDDYYDTLLRPVVLSHAASADETKVVQKTLSLFNSAEKIEDIDTDFRQLVITTAARKGGKPEFEKMLRLLKETESPEDRVTLLSGLLRFKDPTQSIRGLELIRSKNVRLQDVGYAISYALSNRTIKRQSWEWLTTNWSWIKANLGNDMTYSRIPVYVAQNRSTQQFVGKYTDFFQKVKEPALELSTKQGLELMQAQIKWRAVNEPSLIVWLKANRP